MTNTTLVGWRPPSSPLSWARPVQVEDATAGLTACSLPDKRALLMWPLDLEVRFAVLDSMQQTLVDNVVTAPMIQTAVSVASATDAGIWRACVFRDGPDVFCTVLGSTGANDEFWVRVYKLDDPSSPSTWSLHGTVQAGILYHGSGLSNNVGGNTNVGQPLILESGRWVLAAADAYRATVLGSVIAGRESSFWYSDDQGATWTGPTATYNHDGPLTRAHFSPGQSAQIPGGDLVSMGILQHGVGGGLRSVVTILSDDNGESWSMPGYGPDDSSNTIQAFLDNSSEVYAVWGSGDDAGEIWELGSGQWVPRGPSIWNPATGTNFGAAGEDGAAVKFIIDRGYLWHFVGQWVARSGRGWHVGFVGS